MNGTHELMKVFERYFERNPVQDCLGFRNNPEVIVIIPVLNDRDIFATVDSLRSCSCTYGNAGVVIVVNHSENADSLLKEANRELAAELRAYTGGGYGDQVRISFKVIEAFDLPMKIAGVGLARKIAMDCAAWFFYLHGKQNCPIVSLDADTLVDENYLDAILCFFREKAVDGVSIAYAHRLEDCDRHMREAMIRYELYLRYYQLALGYTGHPHAFHCIGSAFAVRVSAYVAQGGMNRRQAGEDFYFLQKLISTGRYGRLDTTRVYPSARFSARTPFGTGQAVRQIVEGDGNYPVYHFQAFRDLKRFFDHLDILYKAEEEVIIDYFACQAKGVQHFLSDIDGRSLVAEVNANSASYVQFSKRFFDCFNAFRVLKYLNYVHGSIYPKIDIIQATEFLFQELEYPLPDDVSGRLDFLRNL